MFENIDRLTYLQYAALEGEVAFALATSPHDAEMKYRIFMALREVPTKLRPYVDEAIRNSVTFDQTELERIILEVDNKTTPVWLWIDRTIADIKLACAPTADVQASPLKTSVNKTNAKKAILKSAFVMFIRTSALICSQSTKKLCYAIMEDNDLEFLKEMCFMLLQEIDELEMSKPPKTLPNPDILDVSIDLKDIMSFSMEVRAMDEISKVVKGVKSSKKSSPRKSHNVPVTQEVFIDYAEPQESPNEGTEFSSEEISQFISSKLEELFTGQAPKPKVRKDKSKVVFKVLKTYNGSQISTVLQVFDKCEEAVEFVEDMKKKFPELNNTCKIEIFKEESD